MGDVSDPPTGVSPPFLRISQPQKRSTFSAVLSPKIGFEIFRGHGFPGGVRGGKRKSWMKKKEGLVWVKKGGVHLTHAYDLALHPITPLPMRDACTWVV